MRRRFEWERDWRERGGFLSFRDLGKNWDSFGLCLMMWGVGGGEEKKKAISFTCANMGSAVEMGQVVFIYDLKVPLIPFDAYINA